MTPISAATLHVPVGTKESYKSASVWKDFGQIIEIGSESLPTLNSDDSVPTYYTPDGCPASFLRPNTITIRHDSNHSSKKVVIRQ